VRRLLRRITEHRDDKGPIKIHELVIDPGRHEVLAKGKSVDLTVTEFKILYTLASRPGQVFTRNQIVDTLHDGDYIVTERAVDVQMVSLRKKLRSCGKYIYTVRGVGYRFEE
jgi:two-component system phosphate regulon response regulator PhoB